MSYKQHITHTAVSIASRTMPRATFYVHITDPAAFACKLTRRASGQNERLLIWCGSEAEMRRLDKELWQDRPKASCRTKYGLKDTPIRKMPPPFWLAATACRHCPKAPSSST